MAEKTSLWPNSRNTNSSKKNKTKQKKTLICILSFFCISKSCHRGSLKPYASKLLCLYIMRIFIHLINKKWVVTMAISTLQGSCAAAEYILEGQMHLPLCYVNFCTSYIVGVHRLEQKARRIKLSQKITVVIKDSLNCWGILKWLTDARLEQSINIQTNQAMLLQILSLKTNNDTKISLLYFPISLWLYYSKFKLMGLEPSMNWWCYMRLIPIFQSTANTLCSIQDWLQWMYCLTAQCLVTL